jgi:hypothetical protein
MMVPLGVIRPIAGVVPSWVNHRLLSARARCRMARCDVLS